MEKGNIPTLTYAKGCPWDVRIHAMTFVFQFCSLSALCINLRGFRTREMESEALDSNAGSLEEQVTSDLGITYNY